MKNILRAVLLTLMITGCQSKKSDVPTVAFIDAFQDNTIAKAREGFFAALAENGFDEKKGTIQVIYRNAQGDIPTLTQITKYMISQKPTLVATCPTLASITAVQNIKDIPIFMMVSETVERLQVKSKLNGYPKNLFGVGETLAYVDTSVSLIPKLIKPKGKRIRIGLVFNQSEPQSVQALEEIRKIATSNNMDIVALPVNASAEVLLVTQSLLSKDIDVFFANPDNTIFASFESILKACDAKNVPIMTSEAGLVSRGALAAYGPDMYEWGYQSGLQAAQLLKSGSTEGIAPELVKTRNRVYNPAMAKKYNITIPEGYKPL